MYLPKQIETILDTLNQAGYEAFVVGGCIRDHLLGRPCSDYDICTSALPKTIQALFPKTIPTGIKHGTITVLCPEPVEVTTFRKEEDYKDHRHPDKVYFVSHIEEDLSRRDFTINAMAYHPRYGIVDPFGGQDDLKKRIVRCVGDPNIRFQEDALRMVRAHRFCAKLHFEMETGTQKAIGDHIDLIRFVSSERIYKELKEILKEDPYELEKMTELLSRWIPELQACLVCSQNTPWHDTNVLHHTLRAISFLKPFDETLAFALLFHDLGKPETKTTVDQIDHFYDHPVRSAQIAGRICRDLKMPKKQSRQIVELICYHDEKLSNKLKTIHRFRIQRGFDDEWMQKYFQLRICDIKAHSLKGQSSLEWLQSFIDFYEENKQRPMDFHDLDITGNDILKHTDLTGKDIQKALKRCLDLVFYDPGLNDKERLIQMIKSRRD